MLLVEIYKADFWHKSLRTNILGQLPSTFHSRSTDILIWMFFFTNTVDAIQIKNHLYLQDVLAGVALTSVLLPIWLYVMDPLDEFLMTHPYAPLFAVSIPLIMCLNYPKLEQWNTCRSDTTLVVGTGTGVAIALWINYQYGLMTRQSTSPPFIMPDFTLNNFGADMYRMLIGGIIALITRFAMKFITYRSSCWYFGLDPKDPKSKQQFCVELPVKFGTYFVLSLVVVVLTPIIFMKMGIERPNLYTEL